jgi:Holliday junction resolvase RusA-like endonuclease
MSEWQEFVVYGMPVPQPRPRISMRGGFAKAYTPADHPIVAYRKAIAKAALKANPLKDWRKKLGRRVRLEVWCVFQRPKSHRRANGSLLDKAPALPRPDTDNLVKGVMDALTTAGIYSDDVVVADHRCRKRYVGARIAPHTVVRVR